MAPGFYRDLRGFIAQVEALGALRRITGASQHLELGGITEVAAGLPACPALLFEDIPGLEPGFRVFTNATVSPQRAALALGLDPTLSPLEALKAWKQRRTDLKPLPPETVEPDWAQNSVRGATVDLARFPAPFWHRDDGGPYIGSGAIVVMRDPDTGWVNSSVYRVQVHGRDRVTVQFDHEGRHGAVIARRWWEAGKNCPVAVVCGQDPALFVAGFEYLPEGVSEYAFAGAIKQAPIPIADGPMTGLPLPATAELVLEGHLLPTSEVTLPEGPFGEFTGYYAAEARPGPVMQVDAVHWRNDPILLGSPPMKPPRFHFGLPFRAAGMWSDLERSGVSDVVGAWQHVAQLMTVVALKQRYPGHSKRAGLIAAAQSYMGRIVVVVDEDVDPSNLADVMWAVSTRSEPAESWDLVRNGWSSALDPRLSAEDRARGQNSNSKMIIDACRPFARLAEFPKTSALSLQESAEIFAKWRSALG
jgi:UbiD family decarboxylase